MSPRTFVPFDSLWQMRIDVPYSLMVRVGQHAWSCGQLALNGDSQVLAPHDLAAQSRVVAGYVDQVLGRAGLTAADAKRLLLYYVPSAENDDGNVERMRSAFRSVLGGDVQLDAVPVPHFYYDGIVLEVDAFAGPSAGDCFDWVSIETPPDALADAISSLDARNILTAHWFVPEAQLHDVAATLDGRGLVHDAGAIVSAGPDSTLVRGSVLLLRGRPISVQTQTVDGVQLTSRSAEGVGWIATRCTDASLGLVAQTERIMEAIAASLEGKGAGFDAVVKSTTLYVGDSSEDELHQNMSVRNRRYTTPGPASTGLPIFGFADASSMLTVDVIYVSDASALEPANEET